MNAKRLRQICCFGLALFSVGQCPLAQARFAMPNEVPVARLLVTAEANVRRQPASAEAHYTLGRIHYLAFSRDAKTVPAFSYQRDGDVALAPSWMIQGWSDAQWNRARELAREELGRAENAGTRDEPFWAATQKHLDQLRKENWRPARLSVEEKAAHAAKALAEFQKALQLAPDNALYLLGLASLADQVVEWKRNEMPRKLPAELEKLTEIDARVGYARAHELAFQEDRLLTTRPTPGPRSLVSWEAGQGYLRLTEAMQRGDNPGVQLTRQRISERLKQLDQLPMGLITPLVISLQPVPRIEALLNPQASVEFDLRGYGPRDRWPWLQPAAGLLVWDPQATGRITSASQLFGGYSFQIFRANGYDALAALDGDGDGVLRGEELRGIRVWFDRDGNGISAPDEVHDLAELGIVALATRSTGQDGVHPMNSAGVIFADGRTLPSWDWIVEPHDHSRDASH